MAATGPVETSLPVAPPTIGPGEVPLPVALPSEATPGLGQILRIAEHQGGGDYARASDAICVSCADVAFCGAVRRAPRVGMVMVPGSGSALTGGRALSRARLLRQLGYKPSAPPDLTEPERLLKVSRRLEVIAERRLRRADMVLARALLQQLEDHSQAILAEVHGEGWQYHRWVHWIFPCGDSVEDADGLVTVITARTVRAFLDADTFAWREVVERIVGRAEASAGGLNGLFPGVMLARIDSFVGVFAHASKRPEWLVQAMVRIRRLRNMPASLLVPGPMPVVSRASRKQREEDRVSRGLTSSRVPSMVLGAALPQDGVVGLGGAVLGIGEVPGLPRAAGRLPPIVESTIQGGPAARELAPRPRLQPRIGVPRAGYLRSKGSNAAIFGMLDGAVSPVAVPKLLFPIGRASIKDPGAPDVSSFLG